MSSNKFTHIIQCIINKWNNQFLVNRSVYSLTFVIYLNHYKNLVALDEPHL